MTCPIGGIFDWLSGDPEDIGTYEEYLEWCESIGRSVKDGTAQKLLETKTGSKGKGQEKMTEGIERDDVAFIVDQDLWPHWPLLPMKRMRNGKRELGVIISSRPNTVYSHSQGMYALGPGPILPQLASAYGWVMDVYDSAEEIVQAGWIVD